MVLSLHCRQPCSPSTSCTAAPVDPACCSSAFLSSSLSRQRAATAHRSLSLSWHSRKQTLQWSQNSGTQREVKAAALDSAPEWTLDQIAGLAFGGLMAATFFLAAKVDELVARSQRRELGLCEECGGVNEGKCPNPQCPKSRHAQQ